ncbi:hypothetical protein [Bacteroides neonati]|uniref:hypothetical protein n=1 Tax=Bacteroides neonati TaxID=1347393 RepID=UPI0005A8DD3A|nr:hypothetical protein [Bacteroides neonati]
METIYDHNLTTEEEARIHHLSKDAYLKHIGDCESMSKQDIAALYWLRDDSVMVEHYLKGVDYMDQLDFYRTVTHP